MNTVKGTLPGGAAPLEHQLERAVSQREGRRKGRALLMVSAGEAAGMVFPVTQPSLLIGRSSEAQVRIDEHALSYEHARLDEVAEGYTLRDLGSTNGTYVNGQRLVETVLLSSGDSIRMGSTTFTFVTREAGPPKHTIKLRNPNPEAPIEASGVGRVAPERVAVGAGPESQHTGSVSLTDVVRTVKTYWLYAKRYGWIVATGTCFGLAAGVLQAWTHPPAGSAWFEMTLVPAARGAEEEGAAPIFVGPESTFRSLPLIKETLTSLGASDVSDLVASEVQRSLSFERTSFNSKVWRGEYEDATAERAASFLNEHVEVYVDSELDKLLEVLRTDAAFDREQETQASQRVADARNALIEFSDEHPEAVPKDAKLPEHVRVRLAPGASAERIDQAVSSTQRALQAAFRRIQSKKAQPYFEQATAVETKIAEARARGLGDRHPELVTLTRLQSSLRARAAGVLAAEPSEAEQIVDPEVTRLKEELTELQARARQARAGEEQPALAPAVLTTGDAPRISIARDPGAGAGGAEPAESLSQLKIHYGELLRGYERAKTEQEALQKKREATDRLLERERISAQARYDIITPPTPEEPSAAAAMVKRGAMGGFVGLVLAVVAAACLELRRILIARGHL